MGRSSIMLFRKPGGAAMDWADTLRVAILFLWLAFSGGLTRAAEWYVAPGAGINGDGSFQNPWAFQTATDRVTPIRPGDVLWLRGGIYQSNYLSYLTGEPNRYIVVRPYQDERVLFDGSPLFPSAFPLTIEGAWTIYRDFEVIHSATWGATQTTPVAIQCIGSNVKFVNLVIHDAGQGIGFWKEAIDSEIYGCIIYYNGADTQEHGIYTQNDVGTKRIRDSIIFRNSGYGIHAYAQNGYARNYNIEGNILFHNGFDNGELFVGSFFPTDNLMVVSNYSLANPGLHEPVFRLNDRDHSSNPNGSALVRGNYIVGGGGFSAQDFNQIIFSNNLVLGSSVLTYCLAPPGVSLNSYLWNMNRYFGANVFAVGPTFYDFPGWLNLSSLDGSSSYSPSNPTGVDVFVRPNLFEPKRANIVVYNWNQLPNVLVDVSQVLNPGDAFQLRNVQDYLGAPVLQGTYNGGLLQVPMTNLAVALPGRSRPPPAHTGPFFGAFVIAAPYRAPRELLAHWTFDEGSGNVASDSAGGQHGSLVGAPQWIDGVTGSALEFDGVDDLVDVPDGPSVELTNDLSVSLWFKPSELMNGGTGRRDLVAKYISFWLILNYPFNDGRLTFGFNSGSPFVRSTRNSWQIDQWYHMVATFDGIQLKMYINGELEGVTPTSFRVLDTVFKLQLGGNNVQGIFYKGALDDIRLYNYALSASEVGELFDHPTAANATPVLVPLTDRIIDEDELLAFQVVANDPDASANPLTFSLAAGPSGATIDVQNGWFSFRPTEAQGPGQYTISVRVHDNDMPSLSAMDTFVVTVREVNQTPTLAPIANRTLPENSALIIDLEGNDLDLPANTLRYALLPGTPEGVGLNETTGRLVWIPGETAGSATNLISVVVTDNGNPPLSVGRVFVVVVTEVNSPPQLPSLPTQVMAESAFLTVEAGATDSDDPPNQLVYSLEPGAPLGVQINSNTGQITWSPSETQGPETHAMIVRVTDNGIPSLSSTSLLRIVVTEINRAPQLAPISNLHATEGVTLVVPLEVTDPDWPPNTVDLTLDPGAPPGSVVNSAAKTIVWTPPPTEGVHAFTVRVRDNGAPILSDARTFVVRVHALPRVTVHNLNEQTFALVWTAAPGTRYGLAYKTLLSDRAWVTLPVQTTAESESASFTVPSVGQQRFYRVMVVP